MLSIGRDTERWATEVMVSQKPSPAHFHVVATPYISDASTNSQATVLDTYNEDLYTNILRAQENPEFGFSLGPAELWYPILATHPSYKQKLAERIKNKSVAPWNTYSEIDERVADGEAIIRNLWFGTTLAEKWLSATPNTYWAWNAPAVAPQTPQILKDAGISGIIYNLPYKGLPGIYDQLAPDGSRMLNRRKANSPALKSILNLHQTARSQHRFWEALGIESDLLIRENTGRSSESFWMDKSLPLTNAFPPITVTGSGGEEYFDSLQQERAFQFANTPLLSRNTTRHAPWDLLLYPALNNLYIHNRAQLHTSEMFATFNAFHGTPYPFAKLNDAWKKLLYLSHPDRTSSEQSETNYLDHLDVHRSLNKITTPILDGTLQGIANRVNTASTDISSLQGTQAIVVFNATSQTRTNLVSVVLELTNAQGLTVLDLSGNSVPFETRDVLVKSRTLTRATVTFLAESVSSVGYTTYYAVPTGALAQPKELYTPYIENEYLQIHMNGGEIERIVDKTGQLPEQSGLSFNEIVAYHLDPDYPEVLWNNTITRSSDQPSKVQYESTPLG